MKFEFDESKPVHVVDLELDENKIAAIIETTRKLVEAGQFHHHWWFGKTNGGCVECGNHHQACLSYEPVDEQGKLFPWAEGLGFDEVIRLYICDECKALSIVSDC